jgi:hypothetical protein
MTTTLDAATLDLEGRIEAAVQLRDAAYKVADQREKAMHAERRRAEAAEARIKVLEEALAHIGEYWNRDQNEAAMADALWHIIETVDAALSPAQDTAPVYLHKKRGTTYTLVGEATLQVTESAHDNARLVIYRSTTDGRLWVRPYHEFHDGRFEAQDTAQPAAQDKPETVEPCGAVLDLCRIWPGCDLPGCTIRGIGREDAP